MVPSSFESAVGTEPVQCVILLPIAQHVTVHAVVMVFCDHALMERCLVATCSEGQYDIQCVYSQLESRHLLWASKYVMLEAKYLHSLWVRRKVVS